MFKCGSIICFLYNVLDICINCVIYWTSYLTSFLWTMGLLLPMSLKSCWHIVWQRVGTLECSLSTWNLLFFIVSKWQFHDHKSLWRFIEFGNSKDKPRKMIECAVITLEYLLLPGVMCTQYSNVSQNILIKVLVRKISSCLRSEL
jgi:hypothetical protein